MATGLAAWVALVLVCALGVASVGTSDQETAIKKSAGEQAMAAKTTAADPQKVIIDTDIGDDIDDAFAVGVALQSPELKILGISAAWGNTRLRARLLDRLLAETGHAEIPVAAGIEKHHEGEAAFSQRSWAEAGPAEKAHPAAVDFLLEQIRKQPGEITLVTLAPLTNIGAAIERDVATFRKLKRVVMMGGSMYRGYDDANGGVNHKPDPEYNIRMDAAAAQKVFASGVPIYVMPLDATQLKLDEEKRMELFSQGTPLTNALTLLYQQWSRETHQQTPTLFDPVAMAFAITPEMCATRPMRIRADEEGYTRVEIGAPNAEVCLQSNATKFFAFFIPRIMKETNQPRSTTTQAGAKENKQVPGRKAAFPHKENQNGGVRPV